MNQSAKDLRSTKDLFENKRNYPQEYKLVEYEHGKMICMYDPDCPTRSYKKIIYNTGDVVYKYNDEVIYVITHDNIRWPKDGPVVAKDLETGSYQSPTLAIRLMDSIQFPRLTLEALKHEHREKVLGNLQKDPHYYDMIVSGYMGIPARDVTSDMVSKFFNLPEPSHDITLKMSKAGAQCFSVSIFVNLNPALQDAAMHELNALLESSKDEGWLSNVWGWNVGYEVGVSSRSFSGGAKEAQTLLQKWVKNCEAKFKNKRNRFIVESSL